MKKLLTRDDLNKNKLSPVAFTEFLSAADNMDLGKPDSSKL